MNGYSNGGRTQGGQLPAGRIMPGKLAASTNVSSTSAARKSKRRVSGSSLTLLGSSLLGLAVVCGFVAYPTLNRAEARALESGRLMARASQLEAATRERDELRERVEAARLDSLAVLRVIPSQPDQASLMRMLAVETKPTVLMQTINAGDPVTASPRESGSFSAVPIKVEMVATFSEVMTLLARAEGSERLVRPIRVTLEKQAKRDNRRETDWDSPFVKATIDLDAVYGSAAATGSEGKP